MPDTAPADILHRVIDALAPLRPYKVIVFGSYADQSANEQSDLDLLVVLDIDDLPTSFKENSRYYATVASRLTELRRLIPIDLIVHTRPMYERFKAADGQFARMVTEHGKVLLEDGHPKVA